MLSSMSRTVDDKVLENRLRRVAHRRGLRLYRSRARDPQSLTYGGYMLIDEQRGEGVLGTTGPRGYSATLEEVEKFLFPPKRKGAK
jgi:hypothetical protein